MTEEEQLKKILDIANRSHGESRIINSVDDVAATKIQSHIHRAEIEQGTHMNYNVRVKKLYRTDELDNVLQSFNISIEDAVKQTQEAEKRVNVVARSVDTESMQPIIIFSIGEFFFSAPLSVMLSKKDSVNKKKPSLFKRWFSRTKPEQPKDKVDVKLIWDK